MATVAQDLLNIEKIIKEEYLPFFKNHINTDPSPFLEKIKKTSLDSAKGTFGARIGIGGGFGMSEERAPTPNAHAPIYNSLTFTSKDAYTDIRVSNKAVQLGQSNRAAMINSVTDNIEASYEASDWNMGRMMFGDGTGILAKITAAASGTTVITVDDVSNVIEGLTIDVYKYASAGASDGTLDTVNACVQIVAIDPENKKLTLSGPVTVSNATDGTYGFITVQNSYMREFTGLKSIFDPAITTIYGTAKADAPWLKPRSYDAKNDIDDIKLTDAVSFAKDSKRAKIDMILCGADAFRAYEAYMRSANVSVVEKQMYVGGAVGYKVVVGSQEVEIVRERFVPSTKMWGVDTSLFELKQTGWDFASYQGSIFTLMPGTSEYRALLANYGELICRNPGALFEITNAGDAV